jgi:hypothetical protein
MLHIEKGFKMMERCKNSEEECDAEQVGDSYITNLKNSSVSNKKSIAYLFKLKEINKQKEQAFRLLGD